LDKTIVTALLIIAGVVSAIFVFTPFIPPSNKAAML